MPVYKDYINAFMLACESYADEQETPPMRENVLTAAYNQGYAYGIVASAMTVVQEMKNILAVSEWDLTDECHTNPEEAVQASLESVAEYYRQKYDLTDSNEIVMTSKAFEEYFHTHEETRELTLTFNRFPKMEQEHNAFDRGSKNAARDFFFKELRGLIANYQNAFDPEEHPHMKRKAPLDNVQKIRMQ